jgi:hypothetical protein
VSTRINECEFGFVKDKSLAVILLQKKHINISAFGEFEGLNKVSDMDSE